MIQNLKRIIPKDSLIKAGIDTCTLVEIFKEKWSGIVVKTVQNFFQLFVGPTVHLEFLNFQIPFRCVKVKTKQEFLQILGCEILNSTETPQLTDDPDRQIIEEYWQHGIYLIISDDGRFQDYAKLYSGIQILNGRLLRWVLSNAAREELQ